MSDFSLKVLEILASFLGVFAGAGASIYVFRKGKIIEDRKDIERLNSLEQYVKDYIRDLSIPIKKQSRKKRPP